MSIQTQHYLQNTEAKIQAAATTLRLQNSYGAIGILAGTYNPKAPYRADLEEDIDTAPIPDQGDREATYMFYVTSSGVTLYSVVPGAVTLQGELTALVNDNTSGPYHVFRGGCIYLDDTADRATIWGLDLDGMIPYQPLFNKNSICHNKGDGWDCWDTLNKCIYSHSPDARILDCKIHNWAGEMIYAGTQSFKRLEIGQCDIYNNQVSALSGTWQLYCHHCEFYEIYGQIQEGLHNWTCRYYDCYYRDSHAGLNILGTVTGTNSTNKWWIDVQGNLFVNMPSPVFGCIYLSKQLTSDVDSPENIGVRSNVFMDARTVFSSSLGIVQKNFVENNLIVQDKISRVDGVFSKTGSIEYSLFRGNTFWPSQDALDSGYLMYSGTLDIGKHVGTRWVDNYYHDCKPPVDAVPAADPATQVFFRDEIYDDLTLSFLPQRTSSGTPDDVPIPVRIHFDQAPISTGVYALKFSVPMYLRLETVDGVGDPLYPNGTELRLVAIAAGSASVMPYVIDGRGCQLKDRFPVFLATSDYLLLRYDANLKLWTEVGRDVARATSVLKLRHHGAAADLPLFGSIPALTVDSVNVVDVALRGWTYHETDTGLTKVYTASGWQTVWS